LIFVLYSFLELENPIPHGTGVTEYITTKVST
jgi:hypothetical protein